MAALLGGGVALVGCLFLHEMNEATFLAHSVYSVPMDASVFGLFNFMRKFMFSIWILIGMGAMKSSFFSEILVAQGTKSFKPLSVEFSTKIHGFYIAPIAVVIVIIFALFIIVVYTDFCLLSSP